MDKYPSFRIVDRSTGDVIGEYSTACKAFSGHENRDVEKHPDVKVEVYGFLNSSEGVFGSYWFLSMENLKKLVDKECREPEGPFCL